MDTFDIPFASIHDPVTPDIHGMLSQTRVSFPLRRPALGFALVALALAAPLTAQKQEAQDKIIKQSGQVIRGCKVVAMTIKEVKFKRGSKEETVPSDDVQAIRWSPAPESWTRALFQEKQGSFRLAANLFKEAADATSRDALKTEASFRAAKAMYLAAANDHNLANQVMSEVRSWLSQHPDGRRVAEAMELLGKAAQVSGNYDDAVAAFTDLENKVNEKSLGTAWLARAKYGLGLALIGKKDFTRAKGAFLTASSTLKATISGTSPRADLVDLEVAAKIGAGETLIAEKRYEDAENFFQRLETSAQISKNEGLRVAAIAGKGQAIFEAAAPKKDLRRLRDAQRYFAEVSATDLLDGDATAKALYYLGRTILILGPKGEGKDYSRRASSCFDQVVQQHPDSRWSFLARNQK